MYIYVSVCAYVSCVGRINFMLSLDTPGNEEMSTRESPFHITLFFFYMYTYCLRQFQVSNIIMDMYEFEMIKKKKYNVNEMIEKNEE